MKPLNIRDDRDESEDTEMAKLREMADAIVTSDGQFVVKPKRLAARPAQKKAKAEEDSSS